WEAPEPVLVALLEIVGPCRVLGKVQADPVYRKPEPTARKIPEVVEGQAVGRQQESIEEILEPAATLGKVLPGGSHALTSQALVVQPERDPVHHLADLADSDEIDQTFQLAMLVHVHRLLRHDQLVQRQAFPYPGRFKQRSRIVMDVDDESRTRE